MMSRPLFKSSTHRARLLRTAVAAALFGLLTGAAMAGGSDIEAMDDHEDGLRFFGEAKDIAGMKPIEGVSVSGLVKGQRLPQIVETDHDGRFRLPGFGHEVKADNITIACRKSGYRIVDVSRRKMGNKQADPVAIECLMARD